MTTRWLSADEQRAWRSYISATSLLADAIDRRLQAEAGMPHLYYSILSRLSVVQVRFHIERDWKELSPGLPQVSVSVPAPLAQVSSGPNWWVIGIVVWMVLCAICVAVDELKKRLKSGS